MITQTNALKKNHLNSQPSFQIKIIIQTCRKYDSSVLRLQWQIQFPQLIDKWTAIQHRALNFLGLQRWSQYEPSIEQGQDNFSINKIYIAYLKKFSNPTCTVLSIKFFLCCAFETWQTTANTSIPLALSFSAATSTFCCGITNKKNFSVMTKYLYGSVKLYSYWW